MNETRYMVECIPWEEFKRLARKHGWDGKDDSVVGDYNEPYDGAVLYGPYTSLQRAFVRAKQVLPIDTHGQVRIELQQKDRYGIWDATKVWYVEHDTRTVKAGDPDHHDDINEDYNA